MVNPAIFQSIPDPFTIITVQRATDLTVDLVTRNIRLFLGSLAEITSSEKMSRIVERRSVECAFVQFFRGELRELVDAVESAVDILGETVTDSLFVGSFSLDHIPAPLYNDSTGSAMMMTASCPSHDSEYVSLAILLSNGVRVPYVLAPFTICESKLSLFNDIATKLLRKSPASHSRFHLMPSAPSVTIAGGFTLTQTAGHPLVATGCVRQLLDAYQGDFVSKPRCTVRVRGRKELMDWFDHFGVRFGSICLLQIGLGLDCFDPFVLSIDECRASVLFRSVAESGGHPEFQFPRLVGRIGELVDDYMLNGPVKHAVLSTATCFTYWRRQFGFHFGNIFGKEFDGFERISKFSVVENETGEACAEFEKLIQAAGDCDSPFIIPWI
jgi:hypothetical protein